MEEQKIHELIDIIDNELLVLAQAKDCGKYKWFDFKTALEQLSSLFDEFGYTDYRNRKASQYIYIFNWLSSSNSINNSTLYTSNKGVLDLHIYRDLHLINQKPHYPTQETTVENVYDLLSDCNVDYSDYYQVYKGNPIEAIEKGRSGFITPMLNHNDCFEMYFKIDISIVRQYRISFWEYILQLNTERVIAVVSRQQSQIQNNTWRESLDKKQTHFDAKITYKQAQTLLSALQQRGYISTNTTIDAFYYRMTGNGQPIANQIEWIKKAKSKSINLSSIIDFVMLLNIKLEMALKQIGEIFIKPNNIAISLSSATKARAKENYRNKMPYSEMHNELKKIIEDVLP